MNTNSAVESQIRAFCSDIGKDPLLVQGAGGNVSWKDNDILWIKASGTWLVDAMERDIFVPVDLTHLHHEIAQRAFESTPRVLRNATLRPSIETMLHALMPHPIVVHVHAIEALAQLVCTDIHHTLTQSMPADIAWALVPYHKPGAKLAEAVHQAITANSSINVIFLQNHGIVVGGNDMATIHQLIQRILEALKSTWHTTTTDQSATPGFPPLHTYGYHASPHAVFHQLATNPALHTRLHHAWAMYPDHVVFLGPEAVIVNTNTLPTYHDLLTTRPPAYVFVPNVGTFVHANASQAHHAQLQCYYDVIVRLAPTRSIAILDTAQIAELLNWDAEKYRQQIKK